MLVSLPYHQTEVDPLLQQQPFHKLLHPFLPRRLLPLSESLSGTFKVLDVNLQYI